METFVPSSIFVIYIYDLEDVLKSANCKGVSIYTYIYELDLSIVTMMYPVDIALLATRSEDLKQQLNACMDY